MSTGDISQAFMLPFSCETRSRQDDCPQSQRRAVPSLETETILRPRSTIAVSTIAAMKQKI